MPERTVVEVYREPDDWWIGYYRGPNHHYVCPLPTLVLKWPRKPTPPTAEPRPEPSHDSEESGQ